MKTAFLFLLVFLAFSSCLPAFGQKNYELLYLEGNYEEILSVASHKLEADDYYWHALVIGMKGDLLQSIEILQEGIKKYSDNQKLELLLANQYYEAGNYLKAKPLLEKYSSNRVVFLKLIELLEFQNNYREAIVLLQPQILSDSINLSLLIHLGDNYFQIDSIDLAIKYYEKVFLLNPGDQSTANKLATLWIKKKVYERSIGICLTILEKDTLNKKFLRILGSASFSNKDFETSENSFLKLLNMGDSGVFILKHLGISELHTNKFIESREHLNAAFKKDANDFEICYVLGKGYLNSPTPKKGLYYFERADSLLQPDSIVMSSLHLEKQSIFATLGMYEDALRSLKKAYDYDPQPKYLFFIGSMYRHRFKEPKQALAYYKKFLEVLPPKVETEEYINLEDQMTISLKSTAEKEISEIREELFFEGKLEK